MDTAARLESLGLGEYAAAFRDNAVDAEVLPELTAEDLKEMGIAAVGHRRKILSAIARLDEPASESPLLSQPNLDLGGEHRQVAVLFADVVGYTSLTETLGAEAMHELLDAYFSAVDANVEAAGGLASFGRR